MAFVPKVWQNSAATPINAAALTDLEQRLSGYTDVHGINNGGVWATANAYAIGDTVVYQGSSYRAIAAVAAGGANPRVDVANWMLIAQGGGEIAYAEYAAGNIVGPTAAATLFDIPNLSIPIPAGTGAFSLEAWCLAQINWLSTAVAGDSATFRMAIIDEGGIWVAQSAFKLPVIASSSTTVTFNARRRVPALAAAKTYKACLYIDTFTHVNNTVLFGTPGNVATSASIPPAFIQAVAL